MKGMSLPINVVVIIVIAVLVMLAVAAFFSGGFTQSRSTISDADALNKGCAVWRAKGCEQGTGGNRIPFILIDKYDPNGNGIDKDDVSWNNDGTLREACKRVLFNNQEPFKILEDEMVNTCFRYCCG